MHAHLIFAHPNLHSLNGLLRDTALETLQQLGLSVSVSDLYQLNFKASADKGDFTQLHNEAFFDLQVEQKMARLNGTFTPDIQREQTLLEQAELIIFQFPLWWESTPALVKGYIDRVFSVGWAYGGAKALADKRVLVSTSTGAPEMSWTTDKRGTIEQLFKPLLVGSFEFCGMEALKPFVVYSAKSLSEEGRAEAIKRYQAYLHTIVQS